jgi:hypothetical protein
MKTFTDMAIFVRVLAACNLDSMKGGRRGVSVNVRTHYVVHMLHMKLSRIMFEFVFSSIKFEIPRYQRRKRNRIERE